MGGGRAIVFYFGKHPDNPLGLTRLYTALKTRPTREVYAASLALGLALQTCYLVEVPEKIGALVTIVVGLSSSRDEFLRTNARSDKSPLSQFLGYYLFGRDTVARDLINDCFNDMRKRLRPKAVFRMSRNSTTAPIPSDLTSQPADSLLVRSSPACP